MTVTVIGSDFSSEPDIDPGDGLAYRLYVATLSDAYSVQISPPPFPSGPSDYWVFGIGGDAGLGPDTIDIGQAGTYEAGDGFDVLVNNVTYNVDNGPNVTTRLLGGGGNDQINPYTQVINPPDMYQTEAYGGSGDDSINGGGFNDTLYGDKADAFTGNPLIASIDFADYDTALDGDDTIAGYGGDDSISGGGGNDQLFGGDGADTLSGGDGSDFLYGGPRGSGNLDILTGGAGPDAFLLSYSHDSADPGAGFWSAYFSKMGSDIAGNEVKVVIQDAIKAAVSGLAGGIIAAALGAVGDDLAAGFVSMIEALAAGGKPASPQDVMVVTDFDPREDVLILPLQTDVLNTLTVHITTADQVPGLDGSSSVDVLEFRDADTAYAYVQLSQDYMTELGLGTSTGIDPVLKNLMSFSSGIAPGTTSGTIGFTNLIATDVSDSLPGGGFQAQTGALPIGAGVQIVGAVGGMVLANDGDPYGSVIGGTNYDDALTTNPKLVDPAQVTDFAALGAYINGFGGDDLIYGTDMADTLAGGSGDDLIYSFVSTLNSDNGIDQEMLTGGDGNDTIVAGGTAGTVDAGAGNDTFAVLYPSTALQLEVDLTTDNPGGFAYAAERAAAANGPAPVGSAPFTGQGDTAVPNHYTLSGVGNVIGGPLNDWIRGVAGSTLEGGAGADYLIADAGAVTISYAGSATPVSVQIYAAASAAAGGDAEGDVIAYSAPSDIATLVGSAGNDTLGGFSDYNFSSSGGQFAFQGNGGSDTFQILGYNGTGIYGIFDFNETATEHDIIDLRPIGVTSYADVQTGGSMITVTVDGAVSVAILLNGYGDTIPAADFLFATAVSGAARAQRGGDGLVGGDGTEQLVGSATQDFLLGRGGDDSIEGRRGADGLDGGAGNDSLRGGMGSDHLAGGDGADLLAGGLDADILVGGAGADSLRGGAGDDVLDGGAGADSLRGGEGADRFMLHLGELAGDRIFDFDRAEGDRLLVRADHAVTVEDLGHGSFVLSDGTISETLFVRGALVSDFLV